MIKVPIDHNPTVFRAACFWVMSLETFSRECTGGKSTS